MSTDSVNGLRVRIAETCDGLSFDAAAQAFLACDAYVPENAVDDLLGLVVSPGPPIALGEWIWREARRPDGCGIWGLACDGRRWFDAVVSRGEVVLFPDAAAAPLAHDVQGKSTLHTMRNQLNSVQMNAEVLVAVAGRDGSDKLAQTAERVLRNSHRLRDTLHELVAERNDPRDPCDIAAALGAMLERVGACPCVVLETTGTARAPLGDCALIAMLVLEWLAPGPAAPKAGASASSVHVRIDARDDCIELEARGKADWIEDWVERLPGDAARAAMALSPTRILRGSGHGAGFWRAGPSVEARLGSAAPMPAAR